MSPARLFMRVCAPAFAAAVLLCGCETTPIEASPNFNGDMAVVTDYASFFRLGPQQAGGADRSLRTGERVMLLRKEFGYSRVQLPDNQIGYMANEDMQPAPPEPKPKPGKRKRDDGAGGGSAPDPEDFPVEAGPMDPNLDIQPEDLPIEPLPDLLPEPSNEPPRTIQAPPPKPTATPTPVREVIPEKPPPAEAAPVSTST
jgi:hypothetical protein